MSTSFNITSDASIRSFSKNFRLDGTSKMIIYVYSENCHHCEIFNPIWKRFVAHVTSSDNVTTVKIELGIMSKIQETNPKLFDILNKMFLNSNGVPNIAKYIEKTKRTCFFSKDRTLQSLIAFIK